MGQGTLIIFIDTPFVHILLKLIQSNVNRKTNVQHCRGNRKGHFLDAIHIVCRPSILKHLKDSTHNTCHYADTTGDVTLMSSDTFNWRLSPPQVSETLCFSESLIKGKNNPKDHVNDVTKKCFKCLCCWRMGGTPYGRPKTDSRRQIPCSYRMLSTAQRNTALISCSLWGCPEYYVNQNDERKLPQEVQILWVSYQWNLRLIICLYLVKTYLWIFVYK
jgi:hypothetical protein